MGCNQSQERRRIQEEQRENRIQNTVSQIKDDFHVLRKSAPDMGRWYIRVDVGNYGRMSLRSKINPKVLEKYLNKKSDKYIFICSDSLQSEWNGIIYICCASSREQLDESTVNHPVIAETIEKYKRELSSVEYTSTRVYEELKREKVNKYKDELVNLVKKELKKEQKKHLTASKWSILINLTHVLPESLANVLYKHNYTHTSSYRRDRLLFLEQYLNNILGEDFIQVEISKRLSDFYHYRKRELEEKIGKKIERLGIDYKYPYLIAVEVTPLRTPKYDNVVSGKPRVTWKKMKKGIKQLHESIVRYTGHMRVYQPDQNQWSIIIELSYYLQNRTHRINPTGTQREELRKVLNRMLEKDNLRIVSMGDNYAARMVMEEVVNDDLYYSSYESYEI